MSANSANSSKTQNSNSGGILSSLFGAVSKATNAATGAVAQATNAVTGKTNSNNKNTKNVKPTATPVTTPLNPPTTTGGGKKQRGGVASVGYGVPGNQRQPSEAVMQWATTAGVPTPSGPQMRNVAHGGKRRTHRKRTHRRKSTHRRRSGGRKHTKYSRRHHTIKRKTYHKRSSRHHKKRN